MTAAPDNGLLLALMPGVSRATLAECIIGALAKRIKSPDNYKRVLAALIEHGGWHSNRAWASHTRLANEASKVKPICVKTAARGMRFWAREGAVRVIPRSELQDGPGEWTIEERGGRKKTHEPCNHYDLTPLREYVNAELAQAFRALKDGKLLPFYPAGDFKDRSTMAPADRETSRFSDPTPDYSNLSDPFEESGLPASAPISIGTSHEESGSPCNVPIETGEKIPEQAGGREKTKAKVSGVEKPFEGTKVSPSRNADPTGEAGGARGNPSENAFSRPDSAAPKPAQGRGVYHLLVRRRDAGGGGFDPPGAQKLAGYLEKAFGGRANALKFAQKLIAYANWIETQDGKPRNPGWMYRTAEKWDGHWAHGFEQNLKKGEARAVRVVKASQKAEDIPTAGDLAARQVMSKPAAPAEPPPVPAEAPQEDDDAPAWWKAARTELLSLPGLPRLAKAAIKALTAVVLDEAIEPASALLHGHPARVDALRKHRPDIEAALRRAVGKAVTLGFVTEADASARPP